MKHTKVVVVCIEGPDIGLFWNNDSGWGDFDTATKFSVTAKYPYGVASLPIGGMSINYEIAKIIVKRSQKDAVCS